MSGRVADITGGALSGALIMATNKLHAEAVGLSDEHGRFAIGTAEGSVRLVASADGYASRQVDVRAPAEAIEIALVPASTLRGHVVSAHDGAPLADVLVRALPRSGLFATPLETRSDASGTFRIGEVAAGHYELQAVAPEWRSSPRWVTVEMAQTTSDLRIEMLRGVELTGAVYIDGRACAFAHVELNGAINTSERADDGGLVHFQGLPSGAYHVTVTCPEAEHYPASDELKVATESVTRTWALRSLDVEDEEPAAPSTAQGSVSVHVQAENAADVPIAKLRERSSLGVGPSMPGRQHGAVFTFEGVKPGIYDILLGDSPAPLAEVSVVEGGRAVDVAIEVPTRKVVTGIVVDDRDAPAPDAWVRVVDEGAPRAAVGDLSVTAADGTFTTGALLPGSYLVTAESASGRARYHAVEAGTRGLIVKLVPQSSLFGRVLNHAGTPETFSLMYRLAEKSEVYITRGVGSWSLPRVPAGEYELVVIGDSGTAFARVYAPPGQEVESTVTVDPENVEQVPPWAQEHPRWLQLARAQSEEREM